MYTKALISILLTLIVGCSKSTIEYLAEETDSGNPSGEVTNDSVQITPTTTSTNFGNVDFSQSQDETLGIDISSDINITDITIDNDSFSITTENCSGSKSSGDTCNVSVAFTPVSTSVVNADMTVTYTYSGETKTLVIKLTGQGSAVNSLSMTKVYPLNGNWNDYVKYDDKASDIYSQDDVACDGTESAKDDCIHSGMMLKLDISNVDSCSGLSAADNLNAFNWICVDNGSSISFYSNDFQTDMGLMHLIASASEWQTNFLTVQNASSETLATTSAEKWWSDSQLAAMPAGGSNLSVAGTIYVLATTATDTQRTITADKVGIVTLDGQTSGAGTPTTSSYAANGFNFLWIEGNYDHDSSAGSQLINIQNAKFSRLHNLYLTDSGQFGVFALNLDLSLITDVEIYNSGTRPSDNNFYCGNCDYSVFNKITSTRSGEWSLYIENSNNNEFSNLRVLDSQYSSLRLAGCNYNTVENLIGSGGGFYTVYFSGSDNNYVYNVRGHNMQSVLGIETGSNYNLFEKVYGFNMSGAIGMNSSTNTLIDYIGAHDTNHIINTGSGRDNIFINGVTAYSTSSGVTPGSGDNMTMLNNVSIGNSFYGYYVENFSDSLTVVNSIASNNGGFAIDVSSSTNLSFQGLLLTGGNGSDDCNTDGTSTSVTDVSCTTDGVDGSSSWINSQSSATHLNNYDLSNAFIGNISVDDTVNTLDTNGTVLHTNIQTLDHWSAFETPYRAWGPDLITGFPTANEAGKCQSSEGTCHIYDYGYNPVMGNPLFNRTYDGINDNPAFLPNLPCPAQLDGDLTARDQQRRVQDAGLSINGIENSGDAIGNDNGICELNDECHNLFLINAREVVRDSIGDDDGLCESNEACIYNPNFGYYQGSGDYTTNQCVFQDGVGANAVTGVTMYAYPTNDINFGVAQ